MNGNAKILIFIKHIENILSKGILNYLSFKT